MLKLFEKKCNFVFKFDFNNTDKRLGSHLVLNLTKGTSKKYANDGEF